VINSDFVGRRLREIEEALSYMKLILEKSEEEFTTSFESRLALKHLVLLTVESAASIALHIVSDKFKKRIESYGEAFEELSYNGVIKPETARGMAALARLRNLIMHRYWLVNDSRIYREAKASGMRLISKFVEEVREYVERG